MICQCGGQPAKGDVFCRKCGEELPHVEYFLCECGADVMFEDTFCHACGAQFDGVQDLEELTMKKFEMPQNLSDAFKQEFLE